MPPGKSKEDTWKTSELEKSLRDAKSDGKKHRDKDRDKDKDRKKEKRKDDEDKPRRHKDDDGREKKHRDRDGDRKDRPKDRDKEKEKSRSKHRDDEDEEARRRRKKEERRQREEGDDRENRHRRHRDEAENNDQERRHRRHKDDVDDDNDREGRHRKHREEDDNDRERRHRRHKDDYDGDKEKKRERKRDEADEKRPKDKERHNKRDDDQERKHRKDRGDEDNERRHRRHKDGEEEERRPRDKEKDKNEEDEEERRRRHKEKKEKRRREEEEERRKKEELVLVAHQLDQSSSVTASLTILDQHTQHSDDNVEYNNTSPSRELQSSSTFFEVASLSRPASPLTILSESAQVEHSDHCDSTAKPCSTVDEIGVPVAVDSVSGPSPIHDSPTPSEDLSQSGLHTSTPHTNSSVSATSLCRPGNVLGFHSSSSGIDQKDEEESEGIYGFLNNMAAPEMNWNAEDFPSHGNKNTNHGSSDEKLAEMSEEASCKAEDTVIPAAQDKENLGDDSKDWVDASSDVACVDNNAAQNAQNEVDLSKIYLAAFTKSFVQNVIQQGMVTSLTQNQNDAATVIEEEIEQDSDDPSKDVDIPIVTPHVQSRSLYTRAVSEPTDDRTLGEQSASNLGALCGSGHDDRKVSKSERKELPQDSGTSSHSELASPQTDPEVGIETKMDDVDIDQEETGNEQKEDVKKSQEPDVPVKLDEDDLFLQKKHSFSMYKQKHTVPWKRATEPGRSKNTSQKNTGNDKVAPLAQVSKPVECDDGVKNSSGVINSPQSDEKGASMKFSPSPPTAKKPSVLPADVRSRKMNTRHSVNNSPKNQSGASNLSRQSPVAPKRSPTVKVDTSPIKPTFSPSSPRSTQDRRSSRTSPKAPAVTNKSAEKEKVSARASKTGASKLPANKNPKLNVSRAKPDSNATHSSRTRTAQQMDKLKQDVHRRNSPARSTMAATDKPRRTPGSTRSRGGSAKPPQPTHTPNARGAQASQANQTKGGTPDRGRKPPKPPAGVVPRGKVLRGGRQGEVKPGHQLEKVASETSDLSHYSYSSDFESDSSEAARKAATKKEDDYDYEEDDFEDYDDDFEDDGDDSDTSSDKPKKFNSEMDEIMQAMNEENERLIADSKRSNRSEESEEVPQRSSQRPTTAGTRTFINFVSAKQRAISNKAASKTRVRGNDLLQLIEMDTAVYNMFDLPPINEYELYIRSYGCADTKQAYIQTNDDNLDRDIQTEEIDCRDKWTQHPPDSAACGGDQDDEEEKNTDPQKTAGDLVRMNQFLQKAAMVMSVLLEEDFAEKLQSSSAISQQSKIIVSDAFTELSPPAFLKERAVIASQFSSVQTQMLLTVYGPQPDAEEHVVKHGCVCVWNVNDPSIPQKLLMCESQPHCCCFSPTKSSLAFAGMHDGSVVVWDLREPSSMHRNHPIQGSAYTLRYPTYNTAGVLQHDNHHSAVVAMVPIVAPGDSAATSQSGSADSAEGLSFQLATLEQNSIVHLWVVAEINSPDPSGSEADLGLAPGGRVKLIKSSTILSENPLRDARLRTVMRARDLQLLPSNNSHFYIATDTGCVLHGVRYGGKSPPRAYRPEYDNAVQVTSIDFSPFSEPVFLAGCDDGSLRLYHAESEVALISWPTSTEGAPIRCVRWCRSRPSVFFVLDTRSTLHIWDLTMDDSSPLKSERISRERVTGFSLSNDHSATGLGLPGRRPQMFVSLANGTCEVHNISSKFSAMMADEADQFASYLQGII